MDKICQSTISFQFRHEIKKDLVYSINRNEVYLVWCWLSNDNYSAYIIKIIFEIISDVTINKKMLQTCTNYSEKWESYIRIRWTRLIEVSFPRTAVSVAFTYPFFVWCISSSGELLDDDLGPFESSTLFLSPFTFYFHDGTSDFFLEYMCKDGGRRFAWISWQPTPVA